MAHTENTSLIRVQGDWSRSARGQGLVKISHEELTSDGYARDASDEQVLAGIARLQEAGARDVVVSGAGQPVLASLAGRLLAVDCPPVEVVDPTGGGDTITAAWLSHGRGGSATTTGSARRSPRQRRTSLVMVWQLSAW